MKLTFAILLAATLPANAQLLDWLSPEPPPSDEELKSDQRVSRILQSSGTLFVREYHDQEKVTTLGKPLRFQLIVVRDLLNEQNAPYLALRIAGEAEYGEKTVNLDADEIGGLLASMEIMESDGVTILRSPIAEESSQAREAFFSTRGQMTLVCYLVEDGSRTAYAMKLGPTDEWRRVGISGKQTLLGNLRKAKSMIDRLAIATE